MVLSKEDIICIITALKIYRDDEVVGITKEDTNKVIEFLNIAYKQYKDTKYNRVTFDLKSLDIILSSLMYCNGIVNKNDDKDDIERLHRLTNVATNKFKRLVEESLL